jgi:hypothetical protein
MITAEPALLTKLRVISSVPCTYATQSDYSRDCIASKTPGILIKLRNLVYKLAEIFNVKACDIYALNG